MNNHKITPKIEAIVKNLARWREVYVMLDNLNLVLEQGMAQAEVDLQNSPLYVHRRERVRKQLKSQKHN